MDKTWTDYLEHEAGGRTTGTDIVFGATPEELVALDSGAVAVPLLHLGLIRACGEDATAFLHNLLSNNTEKLHAGQAQWTSLSTPKGRMLSGFLQWRRQDAHLLSLSRDLCATVLKKLRLYVLRSKVTLSDASDDIALIGVAGPKGGDYLQASALPQPPAKTVAEKDPAQVIGIDDGLFIIAVDSAGAADIFRRLLAAGCVRGGSNIWRLAAIRRGVPLLTTATQEAFVAQMLNFDTLGGIRTGKGCYPGQEIITRIRSQGKIKQRLYRIQLPCSTPPPAGTDLFSPDLGDQTAGTIVNAATPGNGYCEALAVLRIPCAEAGNIRLGGLTGPQASILDLPGEPGATQSDLT